MVCFEKKIKYRDMFWIIVREVVFGKLLGWIVVRWLGVDVVYVYKVGCDVGMGS